MAPAGVVKKESAWRCFPFLEYFSEIPVPNFVACQLLVDIGNTSAIFRRLDHQRIVLQNERRCKGAGPAKKVCSVEWTNAPMSEETVNVFIHVLGAFDYYNRGDFAGVDEDADIVSGLQAKFIDARDELIQGGGIIEGSKVITTHPPASRAQESRKPYAEA